MAKRPAFASGEINLQISTASRNLNVSAEPEAKTLAPGGTTKVAVEVKDNNGKAVANAEIAVVIVDESILALSNYDISNPLATFYTQRGDGVTDYHLRKDVLLGKCRRCFAAAAAAIIAAGKRQKCIEVANVSGSQRRSIGKWICGGWRVSIRERIRS